MSWRQATAGDGGRRPSSSPKKRRHEWLRHQSRATSLPKAAANGADVEVGTIPSAPLKRDHHHRVLSICVCCCVCQWPTCRRSLPFHLPPLLCGPTWDRHTSGAAEYLSKVTSLHGRSGPASSTPFKHLDQRGSLCWSKHS